MYTVPSSSTRPNEAAFEFDGVSTAADGAGAACVAGALASVAAAAGVPAGTDGDVGAAGVGALDAALGGFGTTLGFTDAGVGMVESSDTVMTFFST